MEKILREHLPGGVFINVPPRVSRNLSAVRGRNNRTTEVCLRLALVRAGIKGWKLQPTGLPGNPDFVFWDQRVAIFVDGCFWHGCPNCGHIPKTNSAFWQAKIRRNIERDQKNSQNLAKMDFKVIRIWEHELKTSVSDCVARVTTLLDRFLI